MDLDLDDTLPLSATAHGSLIPQQIIPRHLLSDLWLSKDGSTYRINGKTVINQSAMDLALAFASWLRVPT